MLDRIRALAIPPAWCDVWISPLADGHIQAVGTDDAGRRQYRYHDEWRRARDAEKHQRVLALGRRLPRVRREVAHRLAEPGLGPRRVLAAAVRMLDVGVFRAGGEEYAPSCDADDGSFGLATLRRRGGGDELLAYRDGHSWRDVRTSDLNDAVRELAGRRYTCKDLRTWNATVLPALLRRGGAAPSSADLSDDDVRAAVEAAVIRLLRN